MFRKDLNDYIKKLSFEDKKSLIEKALKLSNETGDLAKVTMQYNSVKDYTQEFSDRYKILEETIDVILTAISIPLSLGFTDQEIEDMLYKKAEKWEHIQKRDNEAKYPLPFEIHITVNNDDISLEQFKEDCKNIDVKPIVLDLECSDSSIIKDVMTSSKHYGDNLTVYEESERIKCELLSKGYNVLRVKIETSPFHPAAPTECSNTEFPNGCYFESHIGIIIDPSEKESLRTLINRLNNEGVNNKLFIGKSKLSQNFFKKSTDGSKYVNMVTYRNNKSGYNVFKDEVEILKSTFKENNFDFEKVEVEYSIYDTNVSHDKNWLNN